jgi:DNA-binding LacI/PurR family transcriptional regulator
MTTVTDRAIVIVGGEDPSDATLARAEQFDEVFVVARAVPDPAHRWIVDDDLSEESGRARLGRALARLRAHGVRASGVLGDAGAAAARADARALFPGARILG